MEGGGCASCKWLLDWPLCHEFFSGKGIPEGVKHVCFEDVHLCAEDHCTRYTPADADEDLSEQEMERRLCQLRGDCVLDGSEEWSVTNMIHRDCGWEVPLELVGKKE